MHPEHYRHQENRYGGATETREFGPEFNPGSTCHVMRKPANDQGLQAKDSQTRVPTDAWADGPDPARTHGAHPPGTRRLGRRQRQRGAIPIQPGPANALADEIAGAADRMMTTCEDIQDAADAIGAKTKHRGIKAQLKKITAGTGDIFEACSFQDLTGQRIGKLTRTVAAFQTGFHAIARHAVGKAGGKGAGNGLAGGQNRHYAIDRIDGGITLEGPQINDPAVSQTDIDSLFD